MNFTVKESVDVRPSMCAVDDSDHAIAGAYLDQYWKFYVTTSVAEVAGVPFVADHLPLWSKKQALHWVELVAHLYCRASESRDA
jgi:hypothetical protein